MEKDEDEAPEAAAAPAALPPPAPAKGGMMSTIIGIVIVTLLAVGLGGFLGMQTASSVEQAVAEREKAKPQEQPMRSTKYSDDMALQPVEAVVTNLAQPSDVWIRLETSIIYNKTVLKNPEVTAAEIRQDLVGYTRTISLAQLEGPSALQHLREDLNERVATRTNGAVSEIVIQTLVVQ